MLAYVGVQKMGSAVAPLGWEGWLANRNMPLPRGLSCLDTMDVSSGDSRRKSRDAVLPSRYATV